MNSELKPELSAEAMGRISIILAEAFDAGMSCAAAYEFGTYAEPFNVWIVNNKDLIDKLLSEAAISRAEQPKPETYGESPESFKAWLEEKCDPHREPKNGEPEETQEPNIKCKDCAVSRPFQGDYF